MDVGRRLAALEQFFKVVPPLTVEQFAQKWAGYDDLSKAVILSQAETHYDDLDAESAAFLNVAREYLTTQGLIDPDAERMTDTVKRLGNN